MSEITLLNGYPGSKAAYAALYQAFLNENATKYVEPYVGGGGFFLSLPRGKYEEEYINDKNAAIAQLYKSLWIPERREKVLPALLNIEKSADKDVATEQWKKAKKEFKSTLTLYKDMNKDYLKNCVNTYITYSQSFNCSGISYSHHKSPEKYKFETRRNLLNVVNTMKGRNLHISANDAMDELYDEELRDETVQYFLDPPYVGLYCNSRENYIVNSINLIYHIDLLFRIRNAKASVILCGYRPPVEGIPCIYDVILSKQGWHCYKIKETVKKSQVVKPGEKKTGAGEYIWTNLVPKRAGYYMSLKDYKENITWEEYWRKIKQCYKDGLISKKDYGEYCFAYSEFYKGEKELDALI